MENNNLKNNLFMIDFHEKVTKDLHVIIENMNTLCSQAPDLSKEVKKNVIHQMPSKSPQESILASASPFLFAKRRPNHTISVKANNLVQYARSGQNLNVNKKIQLQNDNIKPKDNNLKVQIFGQSSRSPTCEKGLSGDISKGAEELVQNISTPFDYSLLYLLKFNLNYVYDMNLTVQVFTSLRTSKSVPKLVRFNFENFLKYMITYVTPIAKRKNFKIEYHNELTEEETEGNYLYYRVIIFNVLMFIFNNTRDYTTEKPLKMRVEHEQYSKSFGSFYKIVFNFLDDDPIIDYIKLSEIINSFEGNELKDVDLENMKIIDFGLIIASFISSSVFALPDNQPSFTIVQKKNTWEITAHIYTPAKGDRCDLRCPITKKTFKSFDNSATIEMASYEKITERIYKEQNPPDESEKNFARGWNRRKHPAIVNNKLYDDGTYDLYLPGEDAHESIENDAKVSHTIKHSIDSIDRLSLMLSRTREISRNIKFIQLEVPKGEKRSAVWDNSEMIRNIQYHATPTFLIVEDNVLGKLSIIEELKKIKLKHKLDFAADGSEAVLKFKSMLQSGFLFDFIFMDIFLREMSGVEATRIIRTIEKEFNVHTNIVCVTVEGKNEIQEGIFDEYFEKPIKNCDRLKEYINQHFKIFRKNITL